MNEVLRSHQSINRYPREVRTTVTLDPDVASEIERIRRRDGRKFKTVLNDLLRRGIGAANGEHPAWREPATRPLDIGRPLIDIVSVSKTLDYLDQHP